MVLLKGLWFCSKCDLVFLFLCCRWKARSHAILSVLKNLQADFFCLQEVDEYDSFYRNNMDSLGYSGIYIQRTGQRKRDGCAIFYKPSWYDKNIKPDKTLT
jgi:mRNA deadenylase 3'-5' endonuclease subunit Ccr4